MKQNSYNTKTEPKTWFDILPPEMIEHVYNFLDPTSHHNASGVIPAFKALGGNKLYHRKLLRDLKEGKKLLYFGSEPIVKTLKQLAKENIRRCLIKISDDAELAKDSNTWERTQENGYGMDNLIHWRPRRVAEPKNPHLAKIHYRIDCPYRMFLSKKDRWVFFIFRLRGTKIKKLDKRRYVLRFYISILLHHQFLDGPQPIRVMGSGWKRQLRDFIELDSGEFRINLSRLEFDALGQSHTQQK